MERCLWLGDARLIPLWTKKAKKSTSRIVPELAEKSTDPVRIYLREMGSVPLLTREGEVEIARRFERGHLRVLKAVSRSRVAIKEIIAIGKDLESGVRSIKEIVMFDEEEVTEEIAADRTKATIAQIKEMAAHYEKTGKLEEKLAEHQRKEKSQTASSLPLENRAQPGGCFQDYPRNPLYPCGAQKADRKSYFCRRTDAGP